MTTRPSLRRRAPDQRGWSRRPRRFPGRGLAFFLVLTTLLGGAFVASPVPPVSADALSDAIAKQKALDDQIAKQKAAIAALAKNQKALAVTLASTKTSLQGINADLVKVRGEVNVATVEVAKAQGDVQVLDMQVLKLDQQLADLEATEREKTAQLDARKAILADRIRQAYDTDRTSLLETFLSGETFTDVLADVSYHLDFAEQDRQLAEQIVADQKVLAVLHMTVESTRTQTADLRAAADAQRVKLQADLTALADAQKRLAKLEADTKRLLAAQQAAYARMARDKVKLAAAIAASEKAEESLQKQIDSLVAAQYQGGGVPSRYSGTLAWPMRGTITQEFGCTGFSWEPAYGSCRHFHKGIDIAAPLYTPIRAAGPGTVIFAGANPYDSAPKAWIVIIAHSSNLLTWYAHIDNYTHPPAVRAGQHVVKGQIIAYEGMTGHTTGPHLHWAVELNNTFVNPRLFL
jgi:murein DD-endopeptidase MepM/ murein hydrolase activator NlpD